MELSNIFIQDDLINVIYDKLYLRSKLSFCKTNNYLFNNYHKKLKNEIFKIINTKYTLFRLLLKYIYYTDFEKIMIMEQSINNINIFNCLPNKNSYDLRYIFELIMNEFNYFKLNKIPDKIKIFINRLIYCKNLDRSQTIWRIQDENILYTLHRTFKPSPNWIQISIE